MLLWIDPAAATDEQFAELCAGAKPGGWTALDVAHRLLSRKWMAFEFDGGTIAVEKQGSKLVITAFAATAWYRHQRSFRDAMDRLATDLACDTVETTCFDERLARAMLRIRAKPVSWTFAWQVEGMSNGQ